MPANLPPEYFEAEKRFKQAMFPSEKVASLEDLIATIPKHKGTDKLRADLRRKLSQLRKDAASRKKGGRTDLYNVEKEGAAQFALVGFPNSGKSSVLACLTNAAPVIAEYPLSTVTPLPGMMPFEDIQFQLVDLPPVGNEATDGWVSAVLRYADALMLIVDLADDPDVQGELLFDQLGQWNIISATAEASEPASPKAGIFKKAIIVANKKDLPEGDASFLRLEEKYGHLYRCIGISALRKEHIEDLKHMLFEISGIIRVYSKPPGKEPDFSTPFTISSGSTILDLAEIIHKDFISNLKFARIWGSGKFDGQRAEKNHILQDKDIIEFHI
jgi:ribosome-interacting GTPase 1